MKTLKTLTFGLLAVAALTSSASAAATVVHVVGSTAFRTGASIAIVNTLAGTTPSTTGTTPVYAAYSDTSLAGAGKQIFANGTIGTSGTATIIVEATWTGSLAGVVDLVAGDSTTQFLDEGNSTIQTAVNAGSVNLTSNLGGTQLGASPATKTALVDMAMSDSVKTTIAKELATGVLSGTLGSYSSIGALATACGGSTVVDGGTSGNAKDAGDVAIVPFEWLLGKTSGVSGALGYVAPTNISQQQARSLITSGYVPQALFTGGSAAGDLANYFYLIGRNEDSGTRIISLSEPQFGVTGNSVQFIAGDDSTSYTGTWSVSTTTGTVTGSGVVKFPANSVLNTEPQISWASAGHSGYATGGNVGAALDISNNGATSVTGKPSANTGGSFFIGYAGLTDANKAVSLGATVLTYNGIAYSAAAVQNGSYTDWGYEHSYHLSTLSGTAKTVADNIADLIYLYDADVIYSASTGVSHAEQSDGSYVAGSGGLFDDGYVTVTRNKTEGGVVTHQ